MKSSIGIITLCCVSFFLSGCGSTDPENTPLSDLESTTQELASDMREIQEENKYIKSSVSKILKTLEKRMVEIESKTASAKDPGEAVDLQQIDRNFERLDQNLDVLADSLDISMKKQEELITSYNSLSRELQTIKNQLNNR